MNSEQWDLIRSIHYHWKDKGDPSRSSEFAKACAEFPALEKAWHDWRTAEKILDYVIKGIMSSVDEVDA